MVQNLPIAIDLQSGGLHGYLTSVNAQPMLTQEEEHELAVRFRADGDLDAAQQLVLSHLRYVVRVARGFMGYGLPISDLIQEGNVGLMKAVKRYDPDRNVRLVSFAVHWIKAEIYDFVLRNWKLVRVATTKAQRKLFFNLRKNRASLDAMSESELKQMSEDLDVPLETVRDMEVRMGGSYLSFDGDPDEDETSQNLAPSGYVEDHRFNPERIYETETGEANQRQQIQQALATLDDRAKDIISRRWLSEDSKPTLQELSEKYGVSAERIRQIEANSMRKMRKFIEASDLELSAA